MASQMPGVQVQPEQSEASTDKLNDKENAAQRRPAASAAE